MSGKNLKPWYNFQTFLRSFKLVQNLCNPSQSSISKETGAAAILLNPQKIHSQICPKGNRDKDYKFEDMAFSYSHVTTWQWPWALMLISIGKRTSSPISHPNLRPYHLPKPSYIAFYHKSFQATSSIASQCFHVHLLFKFGDHISGWPCIFLIMTLPCFSINLKVISFCRSNIWINLNLKQVTVAVDRTESHYFIIMCFTALCPKMVEQTLKILQPSL